MCETITGKFAFVSDKKQGKRAHIHHESFFIQYIIIDKCKYWINLLPALLKLPLI